MTTLLAGDIGGTKTLLALYRLDGRGTPSLICAQRFPSADWHDLAPMVQAFLAANRQAGGDDQHPAAACFAVAGPVQAGQARLTNLPWRLNARALAQAMAIPAVELVNDFAVLIYGLPHLTAEQRVEVRAGQPDGDEPVLVLGAGTGLGVAWGVPTTAGLKAVASEGAHGEFAPRCAREWELKQWLAADLGIERVSIERVVSGTGLGHVARWLLDQRDPQDQHPLAAERRAWERGDAAADLPAAVAQAGPAGDPLAREALDLWLGAYGSVTGDLALAGLSRGGIWLAGGTAGKLLQQLRSPTFVDAFLAKGRLRPALETMPITAVIDPAIGQFSAACRAAMLVAA